MKIKVSERPAKILHFDLENRPLSYLGYDRTSAEVTAIAASWQGQKKIYCWALGEVTLRKFIKEFKALYDEADIVTGHYIRGHDLPMVNAMLFEQQLPLLGPKMTSDTCNHLVKIKGLSKGQENLCGYLALEAEKLHISDADWRRANRLEKISLTKKRAISDVIQHKELRAALIEMGALKENRIWVP